MLVDSLGLSSDDRVVRVKLLDQDGSETVEPDELNVEPGWYVEFFTRDGRVHTVSFLMDSLNGAQAEFLRSTGQDRSPPLLEVDSRYVVSFEGAPAGRYPFQVEGNGASARGTILVGDQL